MAAGLLLALGIGLGGLGQGHPFANAAAEPSKYTTIKAPARTLQSLLPEGAQGGPTYADFIGSVTAVVSGRVCATIDLRGPANTDSEGNKVIVIGLDGQPVACRASAGTIDFFDARGHPFIATLAISPGQTLILRLSPQPPTAGTIQRGVLRATLTMPDGRRVIGSGELLTGDRVADALLIVPKDTPQPIPIGLTVPLLYPFEANGEIALALAEGDYFVTYTNTDFRLANAPELLRVRVGDPLSFPAVSAIIERGKTLRLDLMGVADPIAPRPPFISPPQAGDAGLR